MEKEVLRKCIGCFESKSREEMIKITRVHDSNEIFINPNSKTFGRSVYLCYNESCIEAAFKKNKIAKFLKSSASPELKQDLVELLSTFHKD